MQNSNGRLHYGVSIDNSQLRVGAAESKRLLKDIGRTATAEGENIDSSMKKIGSAMAGIFAVGKLKDFAMQVANVRGEFQQLEIAFGTMLGSKRAADDLMSQLIRTAAITPFNMSDVANGAKQLLAYGIAADDVNETLTRLGDIAAGLSLPLTDLVYLYGTTMTQGRVFTQDLRQFMGRGIPLADELAKQFGVAKSEVGELVTAGKVGAEEFKAAMWAMSDVGSKFGGLMEAQSKSITGQISNIEDSIEQMFNELGKQSEGVINDTLSAVSWIVENWKALGEVLLGIVTTYGAYKAAVIAVAAAHKIAAFWGEVQAFLSLAKSITTAKDAMLLLSMATKANPIGLIVGVVAAATAAFTIFNDESEKAAPLVEKFGENAAKTITRVKTLTTTLNGLTEGTSTHEKAVGELNEILKEYGISQIKEGDNIDTINRKREQAIQLIKEEGIERQRANNLQAGTEKFNQTLKDAFAKMNEDLSKAVDNTTQDTMLNRLFGDPEEIRKNADAITAIVQGVVLNNIDKLGKNYANNIDDVTTQICAALDKAGIASKDAFAAQDNGIVKSSSILWTYIKTVSDAAVNHEYYTDKINKAADAEREAADVSLTFNDRMAAVSTRLSAAGDDVHTLYKQIKTLMSQYSENTIGFTIRFNGEVPSWMSQMDIPELARLAKRFAEIGASLKDREVSIVNGVVYTKQQALQRSAQYAQAAENKQTAADKRKQEDKHNKEERVNKSKEAAREVERRRKEQEREAKLIAEQTADRTRQIQEYGHAIAAQEAQSQLDIRQARAEAMQDGFDKDWELLDINYQHLLNENERREKEMIEALAKNKLNEWLNDNPKATKEQQSAYYSSLVDKDSPTRLKRNDLTSGQQNQLSAFDVINEQIHQTQLKELYQRLLDDYQDYETRRTAIHTKYDKQRKALEEIGKADGNIKKNLIDGWDTMSSEERTSAWDSYVAKVKSSLSELSRQEKEEIKSVNDDEVAAIQKSSKLLVDLFSDAADKSGSEMRKLIDETDALLEYLKSTAAEDITPKFGFTAEQLKTMKASPEQLEAITDKLKQLKEVARKNNPFETLASDTKALFSNKKYGEKEDDTEARLKKLGTSVAECADMVGDLAGELANMFEAAGNDGLAQAMSDVQGVMSSVSNIGKAFAEGGLVDGIAAVAGEAINWAAKAFQAAAQHAAALKEIMKEVTAQQRAYNLSLLEESLNMEKAVTVFGNLDYMKAQNYIRVIRDANFKLRNEIKYAAKQNEILTKTSKGYAIFGNNVKKAPYSGLSNIQIKTGHKKTGLFGWGKGKDLYSSILDVYPKLIDGQGKFNTELAKTIIESRTFSGEGKETLQYMIDLSEKSEEAYKSLKDYMVGIFGDLGNTMSEALVDAFRNGSDAADEFGNAVGSMLEKIGEQIVFSAMFDTIIQEANDAMLATMSNVSLTEEQKFNQYISILDTMTSGILGQQDNYNALLKQYQDLAAAKGVNLWQKESESSRKASEKGIATASQNSIDELNGRMTAVQGHTFSISENTKALVNNTAAILRSVMGIERNTNDLPNRLSTMESDLSTVKRTMNDIALKGIKIKTL